MSDNLFQQQLTKKILVLDGAMGTMIQSANLTSEDYGGKAHEGCNEHLNLTAPTIVESIHEAYLEAGADIIATNSFGGTSVVLEEYSLGHKAYDINKTAAQLAKKAAAKFSTPDWPRFVAGSMGPTTKSLSLTGGISFAELANHYKLQATGLIDGGVDLLLLETCQDTLNIKAAFVGIKEAFSTLKREVPLIISGTLEPMGTTLAGQNVEALYISIEHMKPIAVGLNCAAGPEFLRDHVRTLAGLADTAIICYPNAGLPDEEGNYDEAPDTLAQKIAEFAKNGWLNITGGCCGTTPEHIKKIAEAVKNLPPRRIEHKPFIHMASGLEPLIYDPSMRPLMVGERSNVIGSKKFRTLIEEGKFEEASEVAKAQVKNGAHVVDICLANPDRNELEDMQAFIQHVVKKVKVPLVIDSTDDEVIKTALAYCQGKVIINSINLEEGPARFNKTLPLVKLYGASMVVGTIDEKGMALSRERKLEIAQRSYDILVKEWGLNPADIIFDPLVFPVGTGDEAYLGSARETIEAIRLIKRNFPECLTILGISNVSFGLPPLGREVLNSVFLYHCTQAGLDYAIVNTEKLERYASIPQEEVLLAENILFDTNEQTISNFTLFYRSKVKETTTITKNLSLQVRLANYVLEGTKEGLKLDLENALKEYSNPLEIINGPLMSGMSEVGRLFNNNQLIVAEVLQSAEVMHTAVSFLEPYLEKGAEAKKGIVLLATVKGDVHDIGKNLVDIILSNNGFNVIDLGTKVSSDELIKAVNIHKPDIIGLSGLLVKSAYQMVHTAQDLRQAGISVPIIVGGAALSQSFSDTKIAPEYLGRIAYAKDAMHGLALANELLKPQDLDRFRIEIDLSEVKPLINLQMLLGHHLGLKGQVSKLLENKDKKALQLKELIDSFFEEEQGIFSPAGVYKFFPVQAKENSILIYDQDKHTLLEKITFPRQKEAPFLCLADYIKTTDSEEMDYIGFFVATAGSVNAIAVEKKSQGELLESYALQATALQLAEACAEYLHGLMQAEGNFENVGKRYSPGYAVWPSLEDQQKIFKLLKPEDIGVVLTEGFMMEPEASVSGLIIWHPEAKYFSI